MANCLAQSQALMAGKCEKKSIDTLLKQGYSATDAAKLAKHKVVPGNKPSNTLLIDQITPHALGSLIALYEHKVFTQSVIWHINAFDQWGVELGKSLSQPVLAAIEDKSATDTFDTSTAGLIKRYLS